MPSFVTAGVLAAGDVRAALVRCDGRDARRPEAEQVDDQHAWIVLAGRFAWSDRKRRAVADPATALLLAAGEPFEVRHPHGGGDVVLSVRGPAARLAAQRGAPGPRPLSLVAFTRFAALAARLRAGAPVDALAVEETVCASFDEPPRPPTATRRDRDLAAAIAHELHLRFDEPAPLSALAAAAGVSVFHACRAFRRATGTSIHQHRQAVRARHALALLLDTSLPLAQVAAECGYASQAHMTNHFRRALGVTPRQARAGRLA